MGEHSHECSPIDASRRRHKWLPSRSGLEMVIVVAIVAACTVAVAKALHGVAGSSTKVACGATRDAVDIAAQVFRVQNSRYPVTLDELMVPTAPLLKLGQGVIATDHAPGRPDIIRAPSADGWVISIAFADSGLSTGQAPQISGCES